MQSQVEILQPVAIPYLDSLKSPKMTTLSRTELSLSETVCAEFGSEKDGNANHKSNVVPEQKHRPNERKYLKDNNIHRIGKCFYVFTPK